MNWLNKHPRAKEMKAEMELLEAEYHIRYDSYLNKKQMSYYARKMNVSKLFKQHQWKVPPLRK